MFHWDTESFDNFSMHCQFFKPGMIQYPDITLFYLDESSVRNLGQDLR